MRINDVEWTGDTALRVRVHTMAPGCWRSGMTIEYPDGIVITFVE